MKALITYGFKKSNKTQSNTNLYILIFLCICDPYIHMNIILAKQKTKTRTLFNAEKGQLNSVASCMRFSKDRLEQVQKHMI